MTKITSFNQSRIFTMKISLLGAGYWGSKIAEELATIPGVEETEIVDIKDGKSINDIRFDNVIVATPAWEHHKQTIELLKRNKNLYVEKPLALTLDECNEIKTYLNDQTLMVGHIFLYNGRVHKVKELLPQIGKVQFVEANRLNWGRFQKKISTLTSLAPHDVSILDYFFGTHTYTDIQHTGYKFSSYDQCDRDEYQFKLNGIDIKLNLSWYHPEKIRTYTIIGEKGIIFWDEENEFIRLTTELWNGDRFNYETKSKNFFVSTNPLKNELQEFVDCVTVKKKPISDIENAINVAQNLEILKKISNKTETSD